MRISLLSLTLALPLVALHTAAAQTSEDRVLRFNGVSDYVVAPKLLTAANTFTIEAWVRPTQPHEIDMESDSGYAGLTGQKYAIYAMHGTECWGSGHAGIGISVGTNGVSVYEHAAYHMPATLVYEGAIDGWTHIAVVYREKKPVLYINGVLAKAGLPSRQISLHPSTGKKPGTHVFGGIGGGPYGYFKGELDNVRVWDVARNEMEITTSMNGTLDATPHLVLNYEMNQSGEGDGLDVRSSRIAEMTGRTIGTATTPIFMPRVEQVVIESTMQEMIPEASTETRVEEERPRIE